MKSGIPHYSPACLKLKALPVEILNDMGPLSLACPCFVLTGLLQSVSRKPHPASRTSLSI